MFPISWAQNCIHLILFVELVIQLLIVIYVQRRMWCVFNYFLTVFAERKRKRRKQNGNWMPEAINDCSGTVTCTTASVFQYVEHANCFYFLLCYTIFCRFFPFIIRTFIQNIRNHSTESTSVVAVYCLISSIFTFYIQADHSTRSILFKFARITPCFRHNQSHIRSI